MILFKKADDLIEWLDTQRQNEKTIGFVPTMGALHTGHISLIKESEKNNAITVCSIFINPTQFNDPADFEKYPVTIEKDIEMLETAGCDGLFLPGVNEIYPGGITAATKLYDLGHLEGILEGKYRPGHFQGVCLVVELLLTISNPDVLYLGQKDFQQCMVINRLLHLMRKEERIKIKICPTLREKNGLAMSSRNMRLSEAERAKASIIYESLVQIKKELIPGRELFILKEMVEKKLAHAGFQTDYVEIADAATLSSISIWDGKQKLVALIAAFLNGVRLIDNMIITE